MEKQDIPSTITLKKNKVVAHRISDGSELISGEIQASTLEQQKRHVFSEAGATLLTAIALFTTFAVS